MTHPTQGLDEVVHQRTRLGVLVVLAEADRVQFGFLQRALGLTDGNLSRHLQTLEKAGYIEIDKGYEGRRPRTWVHITKPGRRALAQEISLLQHLVSRFESHSTEKPVQEPGADMGGAVQGG
ncbi:MAG: transcriptional regulator [Actinomycetota bacterium]|nr:transcriptional regulator [Actinomycetota bacterium]